MMTFQAKCADGRQIGINLERIERYEFHPKGSQAIGEGEERLKIWLIDRTDDLNLEISGEAAAEATTELNRLTRSVIRS